MTIKTFVLRHNSDHPDLPKAGQMSFRSLDQAVDTIKDTYLSYWKKLSPGTTFWFEAWEYFDPYHWTIYRLYTITGKSLEYTVQRDMIHHYRALYDHINRRVEDCLQTDHLLIRISIDAYYEYWHTEAKSQRRCTLWMARTAYEIRHGSPFSKDSIGEQFRWYMMVKRVMIPVWSEIEEFFKVNRESAARANAEFNIN